MRQIILPESRPKKRLIEVAEQLFAERGFETVSVRDITQAAGANVAAVNYHFGSREGLVTIVMLRAIRPVTEERLARLDAAERKFPGKAVPLEEILDAFVRPLVTQVRKTELSERLFYKLVGRIFGGQGAGVPEVIEAEFRPTFDRFGRAFAKALPTVDSEELVWRIHFMVGGMIHSLTHEDILRQVTDGVAGNPAMDTTLARFIRYSAAGLREGTEVHAPAEKGPQAVFNF